MSTIRVGVLRGGPSSEYDVSLQTGASILSSLSHEKYENKYHPRDILIDKHGAWHMYGLAIDPHKAISQVDVFVNALHGAYGEDGKIQAFLDKHGACYTGSGALASAVGMNKVLTKKAFTQHNIHTPHYLVIDKEYRIDDKELGALAREIFHTFPMPAIVKPASGGSSIGISIVRTFAGLEPAIRQAFEYGDEHSSVLIEEFISGVEATVGIIDHFREQDIYALPAIEIRHGRDFFDYRAKYSGAEEKDEAGKRMAAEEIVPGNFSFEQKAELERLAREIHQSLGLRHYSRSDFIVSPRRGIYALEVNTLPGLTAASLIPKALGAVGASLPDFVDHIIGLALEDK